MPNSLPPSTVKVTGIEPKGDKVCISVEVTMDVHRLADLGGQMLSVATKGLAATKKKKLV